VSYWIPTLARRARVADLNLGDLIAHDHTVWRYERNQDRGGGEVYAVFSHVAGVKRTQRPGIRIRISTPATSGKPGWTIYASCQAYVAGRWPQCSCCGEPMPCTAELADRAAEAATERMDRDAAKMPGACWACSEVITRRQETVTYPGINLDHPLQPAPRFHTRRQCAPSAHRYEVRWLAADARRPRILTWPRCRGTAVTHHDGSLTCDLCGGPGHEHSSGFCCSSDTDGCLDAAESGLRWGCRLFAAEPRDLSAAIAEAMQVAT
jgi:hypothetical protein